jgi:hypothetical protein
VEAKDSEHFVPADEFYQLAKEPDFPDEMVFQLRLDDAAPEGNTFSSDGFNNISDQIHDFLIARTFARFKSTGVGPRELQAHVKLAWKSDTQFDLESIGRIPWYDLNDVAQGLSIIDGEHRVQRS